jgi:20S proteasome alpha/beta subunit
MTAIVGVLCKDGVVIGVDSSAMFTQGPQPFIVQPTEKLHVIGKSIIIAGTGSIGLNQRFCAIVEKAWDQGLFQQELAPLEAATALSRATLQNFQSTFMKTPGYGALMAFPSDHGANLCEFQWQNLQPEMKTERLWYCSLGSTQHITDPFLGFIRDVFWRDEVPTIHDAVFATTWTLQHAIQLNAGGVGAPLRIAVLESEKTGSGSVRLLDDSELDEHRQHISEAKELLRKHRNELRGAGEEAPPAVPLP